MVSNNILNDTEDYTTILDSRSEKQVSSFKFLPGKNCNGLAVFEGKRLVSFDIFGNLNAYQYYFDLLSGNALNRVSDGAGNDAMKEAATMEKAEAFYRLDEYLDIFESELESPVDSQNGSQGTLRWSGAQQYPGFELSLNGNLVHLAGFSRE